MKPKNFPGRKNLRRFGKRSELDVTEYPEGYNVPTIYDIRFRIGRKNRDSTGKPK